MKKISPKVQLAAEKYLASLGSSKEQLTDKQWEIVVNYMKFRRTANLTIIGSLLFGVFIACSSFWALNCGKKAIDSIVPNDTREIVFISKPGETSIPVSPDYMKNYIKAVAKMYWHHGAEFVLAMWLFGLAAVSISLRRDKQKMLEAFIPRSGETKITSLENK